MQYPTIKRENSKQGSSKLLSGIGFCTVSLLQPIFTVSHANDSVTPLLRHDSDGDGAASPLSPDQLADGITGSVLTGLSTAGCSIGSGDHANSNKFWLALALLFSIRFLASRLIRFSIWK